MRKSLLSKKQQTIILVEGKSQSISLEQKGVANGIASVGNAEAQKINAIGQATTKAYNKQADALGQYPLSIIEIMKQVAQGNVKITPDILVQGSGDGNASSNVLAALIASLMGSGAKIVPGKDDTKTAE